MSDESAPQHRVERSRPTRLRALADFYPDGILGASREGVVTILNAQGAALLGVEDDVERGAVLHRAAGIQELGLAEDVAAGRLRYAAQADERRIADRADEAVADFHV